MREMSHEQLVLLAGVNERLGHLNSVLHMNVVVASPVRDEQVSVQSVGMIDRRAAAVRLGIVLW